MVCCGLTSVQKQIYQRLVSSKAAKIEVGKSGNISFSSLAFITQLKKLCNHPELLLTDGEEDKFGRIFEMNHIFPGEMQKVFGYLYIKSIVAIWFIQLNPIGSF